MVSVGHALKPHNTVQAKWLLFQVQAWLHLLHSNSGCCLWALADWVATEPIGPGLAPFPPWFSGVKHLELVILDHLVYLVFYLNIRRSLCCLHLEFWVTWGDVTITCSAFSTRLSTQGVIQVFGGSHLCRSVDTIRISILLVDTCSRLPLTPDAWWVATSCTAGKWW